MNWTKDKSIALSRVCVVMFAALLLALDVSAVLMVPMVERRTQMFLMLVTLDHGTWTVLVALCSVFAWPALWKLWRLLGNLREEKVFVEDNVRLMRAVSWCCVGVAASCLFCGFEYAPLFALAVAAGFMALIVRIVKNVFQQAIAMKSELDLTI
ncbi:MAG: DUF2975 domain-containing protein [Clostridia bacterium]|nr:DUF2975 domain-containing protein [Clostridia bacterium]